MQVESNPKAMEDEDNTIENETQYRSAVRVLDQKRKPARLLRLIMNALEAYRQARKMGWSRPQNKKGLTVFQSYKLDTSRDRTWIDSAFTTALAEFSELGSSERQFLSDLQRDAGLMAFLFVHDLEESGRRFEGITFSLGRRALGKPRFRDRFDLILDAEIVDDRSTGLARVRAYVDPFAQPLRPGRELIHSASETGACGELFVRATQLHAAWRADTERHWSHWTTEYIDYFGPRQQPVTDTRFATRIDQDLESRSA